MEHESIETKMEKARRELCQLEQIYGIGHSCVLQQSMVLDELINHYNRTFYAQPRRQSKASNRLVNQEFLPGHSQLHTDACTISFG